MVGTSTSSLTRRQLLLGAGALATVGLGSRTVPDKGERLSVRIWVTEGAADHPASRDRAAGYLRRALADTHDPDITFGKRPQRFATADRHVERTAWPVRVLAGVGSPSSIDPVRDVNLLLTDGQVAGPTAGYAYPHIATVPGARFLAAMGPAGETPEVVDYSVPAAVTQLLIHEVGHALGLNHGHGSVTVDESTVTVSPMVSGYAWTAAADRPADLDGGGCGAAVPAVDGHRRRLSMAYSRCAAAALHSYRGDLLG